MLPNFFVVGTPKAGTTSLYNYLAQHPAIYMSPIKEPAYFATDLAELKRQLNIHEPDPQGLRDYLNGPMTERRAGVVTDWEQYLKLFRNVRTEQAIGEASGNYLASHSAPALIRARIPAARIVMILRDPARRLFSQYSQAVGHGDAAPGFLDWLATQQALEARLSPPLGAVWNGFYARHVERYRTSFPPSQVKVCLYEDYAADPHAVLRELFSFLQVDPGFRSDVSVRHNVVMQPRFPQLRKVLRPVRSVLGGRLPGAVSAWGRTLGHKPLPGLTPDERAAALGIYREDIRQLQELIGRDLSAWLRP
jgi:hypothetical protein